MHWGHAGLAWHGKRPTAGNIGRLIFIHLQCWEVLPFCRFQRQRCIKILCPKGPDFYTLLALKTAKGQHLPALEVYKNQSPKNQSPKYEEKKENQMENGPQLARGKEWQNLKKQMEHSLSRGSVPFVSLNFCHFLPLASWGVFSI